jgi:hypothetical protein
VDEPGIGNAVRGGAIGLKDEAHSGLISRPLGF